MDTEVIGSSITTKIAKVISVVGLLYHFYVLILSPTTPGIFRPIHILFVVTITVLVFERPGEGKIKKINTIIDYSLLLVILVSTILIIIDQEAWVLRGAKGCSTLDLFFSTCSVAAILILTKRRFGWPLVVITFVFLAYAFFGNYAPGMFKIIPHKFSRIFGQLYSVENGIFGMMTGVSAAYVFPFLFLGRIMQSTGTGALFIDLANGLTGKRRGGQAKVAIVSSALFGTMSGAGSANVVATGAFTIPMMKSAGYNGVFAAAVEAVASTGGQIMPPIMASAGFLAAEITGIPYGTLAVAAIVPALIYYLAVYIAVDLRAGKLGLKIFKDEEVPLIRTLLLKKGYLLLPLIIIIYMMMIMNASPLRAASFAIVAGLIIAIFDRNNKMSYKKLVDAMYGAAKDLAPVGLAFAAAGVIVGLLNLTGFGVKMSSLLINLAEGRVFVALILTAITTIILGMGLPVAASYVITASVCAPALIQMGIPLLPTHLFILHFASLSAITPPVALAAYGAAGIAGEDPLKVGIMSVKIGLTSFLVPFMFVLGPEMLITPDIGIAALPAIVFALLGTFAISCGVIGWWNADIIKFSRALLIISGVLLLYVNMITDIIGIVLLVMAIILHYKKNKEAFKKSKSTKTVNI